MLVLGLNTASSKSSIALLSDEEVVLEKSWVSSQNESEKLLPEVKKLLAEADKNWQDLEQIAVIQGPGSFTALRVSIAVANALAYGLNVPVVGIPIHDYWSERFSGEVVLGVGRSRVYFQNKIMEFDEFLQMIKPGMNLSGDLRSDLLTQLKEREVTWTSEESLKSFSEILFSFVQSDFQGFSRGEEVRPLYFSKPKITKSKKSYK